MHESENRVRKYQCLPSPVFWILQVMMRFGSLTLTVRLDLREWLHGMQTDRREHNGGNCLADCWPDAEDTSGLLLYFAGCNESAIFASTHSR